MSNAIVSRGKSNNNLKMTLQCNNYNERAIIDLLLHACMVHLKLLLEKTLQVYNRIIYCIEIFIKIYMNDHEMS